MPKGARSRTGLSLGRLAMNLNEPSRGAGELRRHKPPGTAAVRSRSRHDALPGSEQPRTAAANAQTCPPTRPGGRRWLPRLRMTRGGGARTLSAHVTPAIPPPTTAKRLRSAGTPAISALSAGEEAAPGRGVRRGGASPHLKLPGWGFPNGQAIGAYGAPFSPILFPSRCVREVVPPRVALCSRSLPPAFLRRERPRETCAPVILGP